ncbi:type IV toxin-antitoxin system AbiEi family antitoxin domain-containing protein [Nocardioides sp. NPDC057764]|uniref:type IV toxin-antitoxin system AbiEi family antitoxin domain-containing protein n=1 Tax=Nocardioides sp. NPDC057764 TaxID=3346243 RepID=UPI00366D2ED0
MADVTLVRVGAIAERQWGLFTAAQAVEAGVSAKQLTRLASNGVIVRIVHGVYRVLGAPVTRHELTFAVWLSLGGADPRPGQVPAVVGAGTTAATLHGIGNWSPAAYDFIVPARKGTRLAGVRLRVRKLEPQDVTSVDQLPVLTLERTIADLVEQRHDLEVVAAAAQEATDSGRRLDLAALEDYLDPLAARAKYKTGAALARKLLDLTDTSEEDL